MSLPALGMGAETDEPLLPDPTDRRDSSERQYLRAVHYLESQRQADVNQAVRLLMEVNRVVPEFAPAYSGLAETQALRFLWGWDPSEEHLRKAVEHAELGVELDPEASECRVGLGLAYLASDRYGPALKELDQAVALNPDSLRGHLYRGLLLLSSRRLQEARLEIARVLELDPSSPLAFSMLGDYYQDRREFPEARYSYLQAARLDQELLWPRLGMAAALQREGNHVGAAKAYMQAESDFPEDVQRIRILHASLLINFGQHEDAIALYEDTLDLGEVSPPLIRRLGQAGRAYAMEKMGQDEKAEYYWSQIIEEFPEDFDGSFRNREVVSRAYDSLARFYQRKGREDKARETLEKACRLPGMSFRLYTELATRQRKSGELAKALTTLRAGVEHGPETLDPVLSSEAALPLLRDSGAARAGSSAREKAARLLGILEERLLHFPSSSYIPYLNLARGHALLGQNDSALDFLQDSIDRGYAVGERTGQDPDFRSLQNLPAFRDLLRADKSH